MKELQEKIILEVELLNAGFSNKPILKDISFCCEKNKTLAIVGPSGTGKSLLSSCIIQMQPPNLQIHAKKFLFTYNDLKINLLEKQTNLRGKLISIIFQDNYSILNPVLKIFDQLKEVIVLEKKINNEEIFKIISTWFQKVQLFDIQSILNSYPHQLSGGQRQRILIIMALLSNPLLLIADEPTTALDDENKIKILELLKQLQNELGFSLILISHDKEIIEKYADHIIELKTSNIDQNVEIIQFNGLSNNILCEMKDLSFKYPHNNSLIFNELSINILENEWIGICGQSGSGKSTFARLLLGLEKPIKGSINYKTENKSSSNIFQIVFQDATTALNPRLTIHQILSDTIDSESEIQSYLDLINLPYNFLTKYPHQLSGGEKQRIAIIRSLAMKPKILICDEIIASLDEYMQYQILNLLKVIQSKLSLTIIFISHDIQKLKLYSDRILELNKGKFIDNKKGI